VNQQEGKKFQPVSTGSTEATDQIVFSAMKMNNLSPTSLLFGVGNIDNKDYCVSHVVL
jgi:hypothetical protein